MEGLLVNNKQHFRGRHHLSRHITWLQKGKGDGDGNHGGRSGTAYHRAMS